MSRLLNDLSPEMKPMAMELIARCCESGVPVMIITTKRTQAEQDAAVASGNSWTHNSRHLTGDAIDICPYEQYNLHGPDKLQWDDKDPTWNVIGHLGQYLNLKWGVIREDGFRIDLGHFERIM